MPATSESRKTCVQYLKGTENLALTYRASGNDELHGYSDADWVGDHVMRRSTSGHVFILSDGAVTWCSKRQASFALSTVESEYMALSLATQEAVWLRSLVEELGKPDQEATVSFEDNQGAIATAHNPVFHRHTKHIQIRYHYVREATFSHSIT